LDIYPLKMGGKWTSFDAVRPAERDAVRPAERDAVARRERRGRPNEGLVAPRRGLPVLLASRSPRGLWAPGAVTAGERQFQQEPGATVAWRRREAAAVFARDRGRDR
jgi:hypothetical protein